MKRKFLCSVLCPVHKTLSSSSSFLLLLLFFFLIFFFFFWKAIFRRKMTREKRRSQRKRWKPIFSKTTAHRSHDQEKRDARDAANGSQTGEKRRRKKSKQKQNTTTQPATAQKQRKQAHKRRKKNKNHSPPKPRSRETRIQHINLTTGTFFSQKISQKIGNTFLIFLSSGCWMKRALIAIE